MLPAESFAVTVRLSAVPAVGVVVAAASVKWSSAPDATVTGVELLVAFQLRQTAVTV